MLRICRTLDARNGATLPNCNENWCRNEVLFPAHRSFTGGTQFAQTRLKESNKDMILALAGQFKQLSHEHFFHKTKGSWQHWRVNLRAFILHTHVPFIIIVEESIRLSPSTNFNSVSSLVFILTNSYSYTYWHLLNSYYFYMLQFITRWYLRFVYRLDFGSQQNSAKRDILKEHVLS